ncbi:uncharacterized protein BX664DRAFT_248954, partial [Halteromyces radiatus]|uniref:uncharacterized protein n=1 Tax=Halteromyces radiatus TaxID=101107 RepID=UPI002220D4EF
DDAEEQQNNIQFLFNNCIRTDGHGVDILLTHRGGTQSSIDIGLTDLKQTEEMGVFNKHFMLWGLDPGLRDIFVATNGIDGSNQQRSKSTAEYYTGTGHRKRRLRQQQLKKDNSITDIESSIPMAATASPDKWIKRVTYISERLTQLLRFYDGRFTSDKFLAYVGGQKMKEELVNSLVNGGLKYAGKPGERRRRRK